MFHCYTTALSHLILAFVCTYCLLTINRDVVAYFYYTLCVITLNSVIGVWRWGNPACGRTAEKFYRFTSYLQLIFALPTLTTSIWVANGYSNEISWIHTAVSIIPLVCYLAEKKNDRNLIDLIITANALSLCVVSYLTENYYGISAVISYMFDHFVVKNHYWNDLPAQDLYNYGLCFFALFATKATTDCLFNIG